MGDFLPLLPYLILLLVIVFVVVQLVMLWIIAHSIEAHKKDHLGDERMNKEVRAKSEGIIQKAMTDANQILSDAEKKGVEILAKEESTGKSLSKDYSGKLTQIEKSFTDELAKNAKLASSKLEEILTQSASSMSENIGKNDQAFQAKTNEIKKKVEDTLSEYLLQTTNHEKLLEEKSNKMLEETKFLFEKLSTKAQEDIKNQLEGEMELAKKEIDQYKKSRMAIINERIVDMIEDVALITLSKKISLDDQSDLVYRALEEAKKEHGI
ncbi:hypothetical protein ACFL1A_03480 [Patescibacteria group bacterium]